MGIKDDQSEPPSVCNERCFACHAILAKDATTCRNCGKTFERLKPDRRCKKCNYIIENLPTNRCPECSTTFNFNDPDTYTSNPPFVFWTYWLPGMTAAILIGFCASVLLLPIFGVEGTVIFLIPFSLGITLGYGMRIPAAYFIFAELLLLGTVIGGLIARNILGVFAALIIGVVLLVPFSLGVIAGYAHRLHMKNHKRNFSQRDYLPIVLAALIHLAGCI